MYGGTALPTSIPTPWVMHCCTSNATQGLYYAWEGALRTHGTTAEVNLLLNRAGKMLDIESWLPYEGKVILRNKAARRLAVRIPYWVRHEGLEVRVNGTAAGPDWIGNRILLESLEPGDTVSLEFPVVEQTLAYTANAHSPSEQVYHLSLRGSTVVDISPRDESPTSYPMYLREHLKAKQAPMKTALRFVADQIVSGW